MKNLGIYIHIPFCVKKCGYCDFYSIEGAQDKLKSQYVHALISHIREYAKLINSYEVDTVYFGGGSPAQIGAQNIALIIKELKKGFDVKDDSEITIELNPENRDRKLFRALRRAGINRLSIGAQSMDDGELKLLSRSHSANDTVEAVSIARNCGFDNISLDMIYALPGQSIKSVLETAKRIAILSPEHISAYNLKLDSGCPMYKMKDQLPDDDTQADMYLSIIESLKDEGYSQYEISNFSKPGKFSKHNMKYWDLSEYLGFGCAAHSFYGGKRFFL